MTTPDTRPLRPSEDTYCKPAAANLVSNTVEVRCFKATTGAATNALFTCW